MQQMRTGIPNAAASLTGDAVAQPGLSPSQRVDAAKEERDDAGADEQAETSENQAADDTAGSKTRPARGKGSSMSAVRGRSREDAGFSSGSAGGSEGLAGMLGRRVTRMQLRGDSLPLPPVTRLFGFIFSWVLVSLINVFEAFAESNHPG